MADAVELEHLFFTVMDEQELEEEQAFCLFIEEELESMLQQSSRAGERAHTRIHEQPHESPIRPHESTIIPHESRAPCRFFSDRTAELVDAAKS